MIITMPPQHGKSSLISEYFMYWFLGNNPDKRALFVTYAAEYATQWTRRVRNHIVETGKELFGIELDKESENNLLLKGRSGSLIGLGIGGQVTGKSADILVIDDPIKNVDDVQTRHRRDKVYNFYNTSLLTRVQPEGAIIIIMTRWHSDDLVGRLLSSEADKWVHINLPAFADYNDLLGREVGEPLWSERYDSKILEERKKSLGSYYFSALYQQQPISNEFVVFNPNWWDYYDSLPNLTYIGQYWDTAFKEKELNDYSICMTIGYSNEGIFVIDRFKGKLIYPDLERKAVELYDKFKPNMIGIEDAASGQSLIQTLKKRYRLPVKAVKTESKDIRAHSVSGLVESKTVKLPKNAIWLNDFINELSEFPNGAHDDQVDAFSIGLQDLRPKYDRLLNPIKISTDYFKRENSFTKGF